MNCSDYFCSNPTLFNCLQFIFEENLSIHKVFLECLFFIDYIHSNKETKRANSLQLQTGSHMRLLEELMETRQGWWSHEYFRRMKSARWVRLCSWLTTKFPTTKQMLPLHNLSSTFQFPFYYHPFCSFFFIFLFKEQYHHCFSFKWDCFLVWFLFLKKRISVSSVLLRPKYESRCILLRQNKGSATKA